MQDAQPQRRPGPKGLGGERVEGRQAVRELLLAGRRRAREVVLAAGMDHADILDDIVELASAVTGNVGGGASTT
jgi:23S rRNA (guanosine2251-2'-O)-methyltransferase